MGLKAAAGSRSPALPEGGGAPALRRELSLPMLVLYGLGTTIGAGIYALTGEVAGLAGMHAPLAFVVAAVLAGITGCGFAELAGRLPKAAGEAVFVDHAFGRKRLTAAVGVAVLAAGVVSAAAISNAFGGYIHDLTGIPRPVLVVGLVVALGAIALVGAKESVGAAAVFTAIEIVGLALVLWAGRDAFGDLAARAGDLYVPDGGLTAMSGILGGAFLAFFAFLGFEDIDSVAEETNDARFTLPRAIVVTLGVTTLLYVAVSSIAVLSVAPETLADSDAPLALVYEAGGGSADLLSVIAGLAMVNGALVQVVMVPRVVYGLSNLGLVPRWIGAVSARTDVPVRATLLAVAVMLVFAVSFELAPLARITSTATLAVFVATNLALIAIKRRDGDTTSFSVPTWLPYVGVVAAAGLFVAEAARGLGWS